MFAQVIEQDSLLRLMDLNLAEANREQARFLAPCQLVEQHDVLFTASGTRCPGGPFNSVIGFGAACPDPSRTLTAARAFYSELGRGFTVYVRAHLDAPLADACEKAGLVRMSDAPGMALFGRVPILPLASTVRIRDVTDGRLASAFVDVVAEAYTSIGLPAEITRKVFSMPERWLGPQFQFVVLFDDERPAAAAMLHFSHGIAGVYWVGTTPDARGKGHATALMRYASNLGFDRGAAAVILQATPFGEPVYRKLGYQEVTRYPWYLATKG
jgi:GNAT superfamily N-acetyltransferase